MNGILWIAEYLQTGPGWRWIVQRRLNKQCPVWKAKSNDRIDENAWNQWCVKYGR